MDRRNFHAVLTVDAPAGAITTEEQLRAHLSAGKPLWEGICGGISQVNYGADWVIKNHRFMPQSLFLYRDKLGAEQDVRCAGSLTDRHIGTAGYNDNWWFESEEAAQAYQADRDRLRNGVMTNGTV
jgi:hypothetical protein